MKKRFKLNFISFILGVFSYFIISMIYHLIIK